jgi:predicted Zn finger-like uncharacterized protein
MILTCPSCGTQYVVKDGAIPPEGRQVRCAACKHSWHQNPEEASAPEPPPAGDAAEEDVAPPEQADESLAEATLIEPRSGPEAEERAFEEAAIQSEQPAPEPIAEERPREAAVEEAAAPPSDWEEPPQAETQEDEFTPFPAPDEIAPRRRSPILSVLVVVVIVIVLAAAFWFLAPPQLKAQLGLAGISATPLELVTTHMDRQRLASGNELLTVTGRVINPTRREQDVPALQAQLKTHAGRIVYSWTIAPPARSLAPGASASFNSAEINVPPGGEELTITLGTQSS